MTPTRFIMSVGFNEEEKKYEGFAYSCLDNKVMPARADKLSSLLSSLGVKIKQHDKLLLKFPLPTEPSPILVTPDEKRLILPNGR